MIKAFQNLLGDSPLHFEVLQVSPRVFHNLYSDLLGSCPCRPNPHVAGDPPPSGQRDVVLRVWKWLHESAWLDDPSLFWTPVRTTLSERTMFNNFSGISWAMARICTAQQFSHLICMLPATVCFLLLYQSNSNLMRKGFILITCPNHSPSLREAKGRNSNNTGTLRVGTEAEAV